MREEGDHVVLHLALDLIDAAYVELRRASLLPNFRGRLFRDDTEVRQRLGSVCFDLKPDAEPALRRPDRHHLGPCVAWNHAFLSAHDGEASTPAAGLQVEASAKLNVHRC